MWLQKTFRHCQGVGPIYEKKLYDAHCLHWDDFEKHSGMFGEALQKSILADLSRSRKSLESGDLNFFIAKLPTSQHWRLLRDFWDQICWIDIETTGFSPHNSHITIATTLYQGDIKHFIRHQNLKELPDFLAQIPLFSSFGGSHFDFPRIIEEFRLGFWEPAHVDLRWISYHCGYEGGLKKIEKTIGLRRSEDLADLSGNDAIRLWEQHKYGSRSALKQLIAYSKADVESLPLLAEHLLKQIDQRDFCQ